MFLHGYRMPSVTLAKLNDYKRQMYQTRELKGSQKIKESTINSCSQYWQLTS